MLLPAEVVLVPVHGCEEIKKVSVKTDLAIKPHGIATAEAFKGVPLIDVKLGATFAFV